ncbi:MAG: universal stress protein [Candidatus Nanohaloarchaea archaeon]
MEAVPGRGPRHRGRDRGKKRQETKEIVDCADEDGDDVILMPRNCEGKWEDLLLGSTAKRVVENTGTPVLTFVRGDG